jgi:hypothetical protein
LVNTSLQEIILKSDFVDVLSVIQALKMEAQRSKLKAER